VSKCLRCGAGSEWLQGRIPAEGTEMGLFSKSGKVQYLCGKCRSPNIAQFIWGGQQAYACTPCNQWFPWPSRIKHSLGLTVFVLPPVTADDAATELKPG
jgi:hypothetical protein